jgi:hypothetical protein
MKLPPFVSVKMQLETVLPDTVFILVHTTQFVAVVFATSNSIFPTKLFEMELVLASNQT